MLKGVPIWGKEVKGRQIYMRKLVHRRTNRHRQEEELKKCRRLEEKIRRKRVREAK